MASRPSRSNWSIVADYLRTLPDSLQPEDYVFYLDLDRREQLIHYFQAQFHSCPAFNHLGIQILFEKDFQLCQASSTHRDTWRRKLDDFPKRMIIRKSLKDQGYRTKCIPWRALDGRVIMYEKPTNFIYRKPKPRSSSTRLLEKENNFEERIAPSFSTEHSNRENDDESQNRRPTKNELWNSLQRQLEIVDFNDDIPQKMREFANQLQNMPRSPDQAVQPSRLPWEMFQSLRAHSPNSNSGLTPTSGPQPINNFPLEQQAPQTDSSALPPARQSAAPSRQNNVPPPQAQSRTFRGQGNQPSRQNPAPQPKPQPFSSHYGFGSHSQPPFHTGNNVNQPPPLPPASQPVQHSRQNSLPQPNKYQFNTGGFDVEPAAPTPPPATSAQPPKIEPVPSMPRTLGTQALSISTSRRNGSDYWVTRDRRRNRSRQPIRYSPDRQSVELRKQHPAPQPQSQTTIFEPNGRGSFVPARQNPSPQPQTLPCETSFSYGVFELSAAPSTFGTLTRIQSEADRCWERIEARRRASNPEPEPTVFESNGRGSFVPTRQNTCLEFESDQLDPIYQPQPGSGVTSLMELRFHGISHGFGDRDRMRIESLHARDVSSSRGDFSTLNRQSSTRESRPPSRSFTPHPRGQSSPPSQQREFPFILDLQRRMEEADRRAQERQQEPLAREKSQAESAARSTRSAMPDPSREKINNSKVLRRNQEKQQIRAAWNKLAAAPAEAQIKDDPPFTGDDAIEFFIKYLADRYPEPVSHSELFEPLYKRLTTPRRQESFREFLASRHILSDCGRYSLANIERSLQRFPRIEELKQAAAREKERQRLELVFSTSITGIVAMHSITKFMNIPLAELKRLPQCYPRLFKIPTPGQLQIIRDAEP